MIDALKRLANQLPAHLQQELKRLHFARKLRRGTFVTEEPEFARLSDWLREGDWAIDVGANIGHYTTRMSQLVGRTGRVFAIEPVPRTFELLAANVASLPLTNVSLVSAAASDHCGILGMAMPHFDHGLVNYYQARIVTESPDVHVLAIALDSLQLPESIKLIKIDVESHELSALKGMTALIERDHPTIIVEGVDQDVEAFLGERGYRFEAAAGSPNRVYYP
jgi:FkbM family methyltransferase